MALEVKKDEINSMEDTVELVLLELAAGAVSETKTVNKGGLNGRPPDPRDPDKSSDKESQAPINDDEMIVTIGREGAEGADTFTLTEELFCQLTQEMTFGII